MLSKSILNNILILKTTYCLIWFELFWDPVVWVKDEGMLILWFLTGETGFVNGSVTPEFFLEINI